MSTETKTESLLTLTPTCVEKVKTIMAGDASSVGKSLRVFLEAGGCSGYKYGFTFDDAKAGDVTLEFSGLKVVVDAQSAEFLKGSVIDFKEDFGGEGFSIQNPNVKKSCGCGNSVDV